MKWLPVIEIVDSMGVKETTYLMPLDLEVGKDRQTLMESLRLTLGGAMTAMRTGRIPLRLTVTFPLDHRPLHSGDSPSPEGLAP